MKTAILGLLAETPIHPGTGRSMGVVDLPVAREATTDYPVVVGSSLKGALRDKSRSMMEDEKVERRFGKRDHAGDFLVSDGRLLLLPVRSLTGAFCWATCPYLIERYCRDLARAGLEPGPKAPCVAQGSVLANAGHSLFLEERQFQVVGGIPEGLVEAISPLLLHPETQARLGTQIAVLSDDDFAWFARYDLATQARNVLDDGTKKSNNLWYEETLPPDTVMYTLIMGRSDEALNVLDELFPKNDRYLQVGGNETVGQGWFAVKLWRDQEGGAL